jgi:tripartite-type tricarboxylate transporter receptor subunit TctC
MTGRRHFIGGLAAALVPSAARPDDFPARPITLIVPFAAGDARDVLARLVSRQSGDVLGRPVVVDNRGGAAGLIAAATVAKAEPDGYTLLLASTAQVTIPPWINRSLSLSALNDLQAGRVQAMFSSTTSAEPLLASGVKVE